MSETMEQKQDRGFGLMEKRMAKLEEQVLQSTKALHWIINTLQGQGYKSQQEAPILACVAPSTKSEPSESSEHEPQKTHHFYCRQQYYPGRKVKRFPVPEEKVPWEEDFAIYDPPIYNQEEIPDSALDNYRNPEGRTGIKGKGVLKSLGPNHNIDLIITRYDGLHLKFLAVWDETTDSWSFPGGPVQPGEPGESVPLPKMVKTTLGLELYQRIKAKIESGEHMEVYKGYVDDSHNTDNAWMETTAINLQWQSLVGDDNEFANEIFQWQEVNSQTPMGPHQREFLRKVAQMYKVNF